MERMNYILCGLAIYGFIGLFIIILGCLSGEMQKIAHENCNGYVSETSFIIAMALVAIVIWPTMLSSGKKSGSRYSDEDLKELEDAISDSKEEK